MRKRKTRVIQAQLLRELMEGVLRAAGCRADAATTAATVFLEADLRGVGLQGLDHLYSMISSLRTGKIDPAGTPHIVRDGGAFALIDGAKGPGQVAAVFAVDVVITKARNAGVACVGVVNSSDIFMIGYYAELIARAGLVGFVFTDSAPLVHPFGGTERLLGTNPLAIAFPTAEDHPVVIDLATSAMSASRVRQASYFGEELPDDIGVTVDGKPTTVAAEIRRGAIGPLAGHKGYALGLAVALLSGPLVGAQVGKALSGWLDPELPSAGVKGHLFLAIDPSSFGDPLSFRHATSAYLNDIRRSRKAAGVSEIRIPGDRAFAARERSLREGVTIYEVVWQNIAKLAAELGVPLPVETDRRVDSGTSC
jgi:L-2-hydroxycarboxylate dehydrogenase (NAD+)